MLFSYKKLRQSHFSSLNKIQVSQTLDGFFFFFYILCIYFFFSLKKTKQLAIFLME